MSATPDQPIYIENDVVQDEPPMDPILAQLSAQSDPRKQVEPHWWLGKRFLFKLLFVYFLLYSSSFFASKLSEAIEVSNRFYATLLESRSTQAENQSAALAAEALVAGAPSEAGSDFERLTQRASAKLGELIHAEQDFWRKLDMRAAEQLYGLDLATLDARPSGSEDHRAHYIEASLKLTLALLVTLIWSGMRSLLQAKRLHHRRLAGLLVIGGRYFLGLHLLTYGLFKLVKLQFPYPSMDSLLRPLGEMSPMGLLWNFMGYSLSYKLFTGSIEVLAGLLLCFRRTRLLGALLALVVVVNIFVTNMAFDVPIKLFSLQLLLISAGLVYPDLGRLVQFFLLRRAVQASQSLPLFQNIFLMLSSRLLKFALLSLLIGGSLVNYFSMQQELFASQNSTPLRGLYDVLEFEQDGLILPPLTSSGTRWQHLVIEHPGRLSLHGMDGRLSQPAYEVDEQQQLISLFIPGAATQVFHYLEFEDELMLELRSPQRWLEDEQTGDSANAPPTRVVLRRRKLDSFRLVGRGFHFFNEHPYHH